MKHLKMEQEDQLYKDVPLEELPWNIETPPKELVALVESRSISPGKTIDLGCGAGNYALYLASKGFDVTGVGISPTVIQIAKDAAQKKGVACTFLVADVLGDLHEIEETFDFAYDWGVLHQFFPEQRNHYVENVYRILNPGGTYLSVCFSEKDPQFGGSGKYRDVRLAQSSTEGTVLYFSSEDELRALFDSRFTIIELKTIEVSSKFGSHLLNYAFMERK